MVCYHKQNNISNTFLSTFSYCFLTILVFIFFPLNVTNAIINAISFERSINYN